MQTIFQTGLLSTNEYDDFDHMAETAASAWGQCYRKLAGKEEYGFARQLNLPDAQLTHIGWKPAIRIETGTPHDSIGFVIQSSCHGRMRVNGRPLADGEILMMHAPRYYDLVNPASTSYLVLAIDKERVQRHMANLWGDLPREFEHTSRLLSQADFQRKTLTDVFLSQLALAYRNAGCITNPEEREVMLDELLDTLLLSSRTALPDKMPAGRHQVAGKAVEYLVDNVESIVTLRSMCEHVGVSERSLRQGFLERYGVTPKTFIKQHRLYRLRQRLQTATPARLSVTQAALSVGLTHISRLAGEYRALFGEYPSDTLSRLPS